MTCTFCIMSFFFTQTACYFLKCQKKSGRLCGDKGKKFLYLHTGHQGRACPLSCRCPFRCRTSRMNECPVITVKGYFLYLASCAWGGDDACREYPIIILFY